MGQSSGHRVTVFFFSAFLVLFGTAFAGIAAFICGIVGYDEYTGDVTFGSTGSGFPSAGGPPTTVLFLVGGLFMTVGFLVVIAGVTAALRTVRLAAWLDGTVVHIRGAYRTRDIDLATAYVSQGAVKRRVGHTIVSTPTLEARDPATGHRLTVPLEGDDTGQLPPNELRALADAMTRGRGDSENDRDVHRLAESLRTRAGSVKTVRS